MASGEFNTERMQAKQRKGNLPSIAKMIPVWIGLYVALTATVWLPPLARVVGG